MAAPSGSGSDASGRAAADSQQLASLSNPELATLPAAELAVHLYSNRRASDFADVALVLAARESRLAEAEARIRRDGEKEARLLAEIRAWERRATEAEAALLLRAGVVVRAAAAAPPPPMVGEQEDVEAGEVVGAHASRDDSEMEVAPPHCTPSAVDEAAVVLAVLADAGDDSVPTLSPLRTSAAARESECNKENEDSGNSCHGHANVSQGHVLPEEGFCADTMSVASEDGDADEQALEDFTETQWWDMLNNTKAQVSAWESELNIADGSMPQASRTVHEGKIVYEAQAPGRSEATEARLRDEIIRMCESKLVEANAVIQAASKTEERLRAEIMECKEKATKTEVGLWAEIQARGCAATDLEAWKHCAAEAQKQVHAASMIEARLRDELAASKRMATEAEARHQAEIKACEDKAAGAITHLQDEISKRDQMAMEYKAFMEDKIIALHGYHTAVETGIRVANEGQNFMIQYFQNEVEELNAKIDDMRRQRDEQRVMSGGAHNDAPSSSGAQAGGGQH